MYDPRLENPLRFNRPKKPKKTRKAAPKKKVKKSKRCDLQSPSNRYRWSEKDGGFVPFEVLEQDRKAGIQILNDSVEKPIVSMIDGSKYTSKKAYTRHIHSKGYTEVGDQSMKHLEANRPKMERPGETLKRVCDRMGIGA